MSISKGKIIWGILLGGTAITGTLLIVGKIRNTAQKKKDQEALDKQAAANPADKELQATAAAVKTVPSGFPIRRGSTDAKTGGAVSKVQKWLKDKGAVLGPSGIDGIDGAYTTAAITNLISADGQVSLAWYSTNISKVFMPHFWF